jgi:hypothetical protein
MHPSRVREESLVMGEQSGKPTLEGQEYKDSMPKAKRVAQESHAHVNAKYLDGYVEQ